MMFMMSYTYLNTLPLWIILILPSYPFCQKLCPANHHQIQFTSKKISTIFLQQISFIFNLHIFVALFHYLVT